MLILDIKSGVLCACSASATFAPMLVPLLKSCLDKTNSFFVSFKCLQRFTILTANEKDFSSIMFAIFASPYFQFSIFNFQLGTLAFAFCTVFIITLSVRFVKGERKTFAAESLVEVKLKVARRKRCSLYIFSRIFLWRDTFLRCRGGGLR